MSSCAATATSRAPIGRATRARLALRRTDGGRGDPGPERAAAERRHQALQQHGVLTAGMDLPAHRTADPSHLAVHPRFPRAGDYHSEWVFGHYFAVV